MFVLEKIIREKQLSSPLAHRGTAVEHGVTHALCNPGSLLFTCVDIAVKKYDDLMRLSGDSRRDHYRDTIGDMVALAVDHLRPHGKPSAVQKVVEWHPKGLKYKIFGILDFEWIAKALVIDLKTTDKMPSEARPGHARQVAFYTGYDGDNMKGGLTYVTPKKVETYTLTDEERIKARDALYSLALRVESFLDNSNEIAWFVMNTAPDLDNYLWQSPRARDLAYRYWNI
jgi:CRISPR/Cas system-associated exonuclease Cas4 (RecB family)